MSMNINHIPSAPVYHRQKLLLFLLEAAGGRLSKMDMQKLLFLYVQESRIAHYAFVPYKFGCYSFHAHDDLKLLEKRNWVREEDRCWILNGTAMAHHSISKNEERRRAHAWLSLYPIRGRALLREVYRRYPYFATRSQIKEGVLTPSELERVAAARPAPVAEKTLFTIGYEGVAFESYANKLLRNDVRILCDVRRNPLSRKFGYSKHALTSLLPKLGIEYIHLPDFGIPSEYRQNLQEIGARERLFQRYKATLPNQAAALDQLRALVEQYRAVALTCFEANPGDCHRHCIADYLKTRNDLSVRHL